MPCASVTPSTPPPLVGLELHGTGAIGILADAESTGYCLLGVEGGGFVYGGLAYGSSEPAPAGSLILGGMSTDFQGMEIGVVWGSAPEGVTTVRIDGGPGDGGIATVGTCLGIRHGGWFAAGLYAAAALWLLSGLLARLQA